MTFDLEAADALKAAFRQHLSGVAIITTSKGESPIGFTATSVTSLGATPPLVSFNVSRGASFYSALKPGAKVAIHTLTLDNKDLAIRLAGDREARFASTDWAWGEEGLPIFSDASSVLIVQIRQIVEVEANAVVICDALKAAVSKVGSPLGYFERDYVTSR